MAAKLRPDQLQISHSVYVARTEKYLEKRPSMKNTSFRQKGKQLKNDDYKSYLNTTCRNYLRRSIIAKRPGGKETINYVKSALLKHAHDANHGGPKKNRDHIFNDMVRKEEMLPETLPTMGVFLKGQRKRLQIVAAELESITLVRFLEASLKAKGKIRSKDVTKNKDPIFQPSAEANSAINILRLANCG